MAISCRYISWGSLSGIWCLADKAQLEHARSLCVLCFFCICPRNSRSAIFSRKPIILKNKVEKQADIDAFSVARLEELIEMGPVFVNFTASWCITCKVNEVTALRTQKVMNAFQSEGITYLEADWSNEDPDITEGFGGLWPRRCAPLLVLREGLI